MDPSVACLSGWMSRKKTHCQGRIGAGKVFLFTEDAFTGALPFAGYSQTAFLLLSVCRAPLHLGASNLLSEGHFLMKYQGRGVHNSFEIGP